VIYAEVIGDPVGHSKSPLIHKYWLERLGMLGDYRKTHVTPADLREFIASRRADPDWRGCNVTIPHKQAVIPLVDSIDLSAQAVGAVNCVVPQEGALAGYNSDVDGVAAALDSTPLEGRTAAVIGAGGGARALLFYLNGRKARVRVLARNPAKAEALRTLAPLESFRLESAEEAFEDVAAIVNASPLGMSGAERTPRFLLDAVRRHADRATLFDMVTTPSETEFLSAAREGGGRPVDGVTMLIGQARPAFKMFFRAAAPAGDEELRRLLTADRAG
jgi:shikimate dehydrogenase